MTLQAAFPFNRMMMNEHMTDGAEMLVQFFQEGYWYHFIKANGKQQDITSAPVALLIREFSQNGKDYESLKKPIPELILENDDDWCTKLEDGLRTFADKERRAHKELFELILSKEYIITCCWPYQRRNNVIHA